MRKIRLTCQESQVHYGLAACAITEVGVTRNFKDSGLMTRTVRLTEHTRMLAAGEYDAYYAVITQDVHVITKYRGCAMSMVFSWPDLRLEAMRVTSCDCTKPQPPVER